VFVLGLARSGTTLLNTLLNQHSAVAVMKECNIHMLPTAVFRLNPMGRVLTRLDLYNETIQFHDLDNRFSNETSRNRPDACRHLYQTYARLHQARVGGEKSPTYHWRLPRLMADFPDARFIFILRPIDEICSSYKRTAKNFRSLRKPGALASLLCGQEKIFQFLGDHRFDERVLTVTYEQLVDRPEATLKQVTEFLGINFEPAMCSLPSQGTQRDQPNKAHLKWGNVLTSAIQRQVHRENPLPPRFKDKIQRYKSRWMDRYPRFYRMIYADIPKRRPPSLWERTADRLACGFHDALNRIMIWFFSFSPLPLLRRYRRQRPLNQRTDQIHVSPQAK
jgi:hypothetical protein